MLCQIDAQAEELREIDMELCAAEEAMKQNTTKANIIKAILKCKCESSIFPLLRQWISGKSSAIDELWTPDNLFNLDNTSWSAIIQKEAIFKALIRNGVQHFSQAMPTPFASGPVVNLIGPFKFNEYSQQILKGEFDIDSITNDIELHDIVKAMAHSDLRIQSNLTASSQSTNIVQDSLTSKRVQH